MHLPLLALAVFLVIGTRSASAAGTQPICTAPAAVWDGSMRPKGAASDPHRRKNLTIVAVGSSSTLGVGATQPANSYPAQLERILVERFPDTIIRVANRGIAGDTVAANLARFEHDVLAAKPDLVIWQVGTNDALLGVPDADLRVQLLAGIARLRAAGADVVLLGPQPLARPDRARAVARVHALLREVAVGTGVRVLSRHRLMSHWLKSGRFTPATLIGPDGLHMTDASYRCLAERLGDLFPAGSRAGLGASGAGR